MRPLSAELFYTREHDWIRFSGAAAFTGIAPFKLTGIPRIDDVRLLDHFKKGDKLEQGAILLNLHYKEYIIPVYTPVTCTLLEINNIVEDGLWERITEYPEGIGWLFKVHPQLQGNNKHLLHHSIYSKRFPTEAFINPL
jgi:glycine cleavage system H lipoate-binding protein